MNETVVELRGIEKRFFGVPVLEDVNLRFAAGRVTGIVGENGAGKSTLMNLLGGIHAPDRGDMVLDGRPYAPRDPAEARTAGVALVHQELNLFANLSVAENLRLTDFPGVRRCGGALIHPGRLHREAQEVLRRVALDVPPSTLVERLTPGQQQLVEIAKGLQRGAHLLLLDEPTTSLTETEAGRLFEIVQSLKTQDMAVVYISHNLNHVLKVCDDVVVLRDGRVQAHGPRGEFDLDRLISLMVGRTIDNVFPDRTARPSDEPLLEVEALTQPGVVNRVSFALHQGEVLGLSGLMGAGRTELARILFGLDPYASGRILIRGKPLKPKPATCIQRGMALVTESRRDDGLLMDSPIVDNAVLASLGGFSTRVGGFFRGGRASNEVKRMVTRLSIACRSIRNQPVKTLSGGNQQKVVLGKWLLAQPRVIILDEPTRGVDVGAKVEIYRLIGDLVAAGSGVLIISSELEELVGLCDRILVMTAGEIRSEVRRDQFDREHLLREAFGRERIG